ncbi:MAG: pseudouridine-5'-phosphate glycosidase [Planctomycetota bacterium]
MTAPTHHIVNRAPRPAVALETTLLAHGLPAGEGLPFAARLDEAVLAAGAHPATIGIVNGAPTVGLNDDELRALVSPDTPKINNANLGIAIHRRTHGATTVGSTVELAAAAGIRVMATGGIGGVHTNYSTTLDISSDLATLARFPVAVVASGPKSILAVAATRELLETLGVPVVGYRTDTLPRFYLPESDIPVDARFDDPADLAAFVGREVTRSGRGVLVANPIPEADAIDEADWQRWWSEAEAATADIEGRARTPAALAKLHDISDGATLVANLALVLSNATLAAQLASRVHPAKA